MLGRGVGGVWLAVLCVRGEVWLCVGRVGGGVEEREPPVTGEGGGGEQQRTQIQNDMTTAAVKETSTGLQAHLQKQESK